MDREIPISERRSRTTKRIAAVVIALAAISFSFAATVEWLRPSIRKNSIQTARVERGTVDATLQASGSIVPAGEQVVSSPVEARILRIIRRPGDRVRAGDELMALDTSQTRLEVDRLADQVAQKEGEVTRLQVKLEDTLATLRSDIEQKSLDADILKFKAEQNAKLHNEGLVAAQEDLAASTAAKKSQLEITHLREALVRAQRTGQSEVDAAVNALRTLRKEHDEAQRQLELAMMRADRDGVLTWVTPDAGSTIRKGDVVARIADLSSYRVDASISDLHAAQIATGMPVNVRIDDSTMLTGTITSIEPRVENGTIKFHAELADRSNARLRNDVRVDVFVVTGHHDDVLRVRRGSLGAGQVERVFVVRGASLVRTPVRWGLQGQDFIEPLDGLREGDEVVTSNMSDYEGVERLRLK
jgi:HlyD family secretion protein